MANNYYNLVVMVMARYEIDKKSETELINIMATKVNSLMYAKMVIEHLNQDATHHNFEELCGKISEI